VCQRVAYRSGAVFGLNLRMQWFSGIIKEGKQGFAVIHVYFFSASQIKTKRFYLSTKNKKI